MLQIIVRIHTINPLNRRELWQVRARRVSAERAAFSGHALVQLGPGWQTQVKAMLPIVVTFTRHSSRLLDDDALPATCKALRDQLAAEVGITDGPSETRVSWVYRQAKGEPSVKVEIRSASEKAA